MKSSNFPHSTIETCPVNWSSLTICSVHLAVTFPPGVFPPGGAPVLHGPPLSSPPPLPPYMEIPKSPILPSLLPSLSSLLPSLLSSLLLPLLLPLLSSAELRQPSDCCRYSSIVAADLPLPPDWCC